MPINVIKILKNNKACADDGRINKYIKATWGIFIDVYKKYFNLVYEIGIIPLSWLIGTKKTLLYYVGISVPMSYGDEK